MIHILSISNSHNNVASRQKNRDDKSHRVIVAFVFPEDVNKNVKFLRNDSILYFQLSIRLNHSYSALRQHMAPKFVEER